MQFKRMKNAGLPACPECGGCNYDLVRHQAANSVIRCQDCRKVSRTRSAARFGLETFPEDEDPPQRALSPLPKQPTGDGTRHGDRVLEPTGTPGEAYVIDTFIRKPDGKRLLKKRHKDGKPRVAIQDKEGLWCYRD